MIARQFDEHPGNYLAFFSSFDYLEKAAVVLASAAPGHRRSGGRSGA